MDIGRYFVHICGLSIHVFTCMSVPVTICVSVCVIPQERKWQWGVSRPPGDWQRARSQDRGRARDTSCTCWKPLQTQETGTDPATHTSFTLSVKSSGSLYCISEWVTICFCWPLVLYSCSISPTTVATSWRWVKKRDRTGRCSRGICATVWSPLSPLATSATRRTAVRKRQGLKTAAKHTYVELGGPEGGQGRLRQTSVCVCVCACVCVRV